MNPGILRNWLRAAVALLILVSTGCDNAPATSDSTNADAKAVTTETRSSESSAKQPAAAANADNSDSATDGAGQSADAPASTPKVQVSGPSWLALDENTHQFGTVWVDTVVTHEFRFKNVGTEPLRIMKPPRGYCSCSSAGDYKAVIQPGEESVIPYVLTTDNAEGAVHRDLKVTFNDPQKPEWTLYMSGHVKHVCSIEVIADGRIAPDDVAGLENIKTRKGNFEDIKADETLYRVLRLVNTSGHSPLSLQMTPIAGGRFEASLKETIPGEVFELTIVGSPPYRVGYNNARIMFRTNVPERPTWDIPIYCRLPDRIEVRPQKIVYNTTTATAKTRPIKIINNGSTPFEVTAISSSHPEYRLTLLPASKDAPNETVIEVILPPGDYVVPSHGEVIRIETNDSEKPLIEIDVVPSFGNPGPRPADKPLQFYPGKLLR